MRKKQRWMAALLAAAVLLGAGCGKNPDPIQETEKPFPKKKPVETVSPEASLNSLRQTMVGTPQLFAVAYFGYQEGAEPGLPVDPMEVLRETAPELCADLPFLTEIPDDRIIGQSGDLFCIVPLDADAVVAVSKGYWDMENECNIYDDTLYSSSTGDPILLFCNNSGWEPDCQVYISGPSGEMVWHPQADEREPIRQFITKPVAPAPTEMIGSWLLAWTEVEGYQTDEEQGTSWIEIRSDDTGNLLMSYTNSIFPDKDFYDQPLTVDWRELHFGCGNREWVADLDYIGPFDTTYAFTLTENYILIKQNYYLLDGAPSVSYEYFSPVLGDVESPYDYALSQGWREPEFGEVADTFWLSQGCGYALELAEDSDPGDRGGWASMYDVDEIGAYTISHSGSWRYEAGLLHLSLTPLGGGQPVENSFPVLTLEGELWIGRAENGAGLPQFASDMLRDTLEQPMG